MGRLSGKGIHTTGTRHQKMKRSDANGVITKIKLNHQEHIIKRTRTRDRLRKKLLKRQGKEHRRTGVELIQEIVESLDNTDFNGKPSLEPRALKKAYKKGQIDKAVKDMAMELLLMT